MLCGENAANPLPDPTARDVSQISLGLTMHLGRHVLHTGRQGGMQKQYILGSFKGTACYNILSGYFIKCCYVLRIR